MYISTRRRRHIVNISFRLDALNGERLSDKATRADVSRHDYARGLVLEALADADRLERLERELRASKEEVRGLRRDLAATLLVALPHIREGVTEETAREWLRRNGLLVT